MIPLWFELGYRFTPHVYVGPYFMYGFGSVSTQLHDISCQSSIVSCDIHDTRFGADVHYHVNPSGPLDPWMGAGFGYEWVGFSASNGRASAGIGLSGWEFLNAQVGFDYRETMGFGIGPFAAITLAEFENASADGAMSMTASITNKALHEWLILGLRAIFDIAPRPSPPAPRPASPPAPPWDS
jgi:hypothetical protein